MFPAFLAQFAAGCFLAVAVSAMRQSGRRYLRLMAIVSGAVAMLAVVLLVREGQSSGDNLRFLALGALGLGIVSAIVWLFVNAKQADDIAASQRIWPAAAGLACLVAAILLAIRPDALLTAVRPAATFGQSVALAISIALGAALLGSATAAMLLGHRYLTDTDMPIAPLHRLTKIYIAVLAARILWVAGASVPIWSATFQPAESSLYFWLALCVRAAVGLLVAAIFAWMVWDCVKRRATQSATALFYLSMILVFIGELSGQYLMRTELLPL